MRSTTGSQPEPQNSKRIGGNYLALPPEIGLKNDL